MSRLAFILVVLFCEPRTASRILASAPDGSELLRDVSRWFAAAAWSESDESDAHASDPGTWLIWNMSDRVHHKAQVQHHGRPVRASAAISNSSCRVQVSGRGGWAVSVAPKAGNPGRRWFEAPTEQLQGADLKRGSFLVFTIASASMTDQPARRPFYRLQGFQVLSAPPSTLCRKLP